MTDDKDRMRTWTDQKDDRPTVEQIKKDEVEEALHIAKPYLIDCQACPFSKDTARTLLNRIEDAKSEVGNEIRNMMFLAQKKERAKTLEAVLKIVDKQIKIAQNIAMMENPAIHAIREQAKAVIMVLDELRREVSKA